jgi:hypothetical protein
VTILLPLLFSLQTPQITDISNSRFTRATLAGTF